MYLKKSGFCRVNATLVLVVTALLLLTASIAYAQDYDYVKPNLKAFSQYYNKSWGTHWCVPTASGICLNYWAQNGYPNLVSDMDGDGDVDDNDLALVIDTLGKSYMGTDPHGGTALKNAYNGLMKYIADRGYGGNLTVTWYTSPQDNWFSIYSRELGKCEDVLVVIEYIKASGAHMVVGRAFTSSYNSEGGHDVSFVDPADGVTSNVMWDNGQCDYGGGSQVTDIFSVSPFTAPAVEPVFECTGIVFVYEENYFVVMSFEEGVPPYFDTIYVTEDGYVMGVEGEVLWIPECEYIAGLANYTVLVYGGYPQPVPEEFWGRTLLDGSRVVYENEPPVPLVSAMNDGVSLVNESMWFNASCSYDPDGEIVEYLWDFGDGEIKVTDEPYVEHTYTSTGRFWVVLTVVDNLGGKASKPIEVAVTTKTERAGLTYVKPNLERLSQYHDRSWGTHWCVPTASGICLGYWAEKGFKNLIPDTNNNGKVDEFEKYRVIDSLGKNYMNTDPKHGTSVRDAYRGVERYIKDKGYGGSLVVSYHRNPSVSDYIKELAKCEDVLVCLSYPGGGGHMVVGEGYSLRKNGDGSYNVSFVDPASKKSVTVKMWPNGTCTYGGGSTMFGFVTISTFNPPPTNKVYPTYSSYRYRGYHVRSCGFDFIVASIGDYMPDFDMVYIDEEGVAHGVEGGVLLYVPDGLVFGFANGTVVVYGSEPQLEYPEDLWGMTIVEGNYVITEMEPPVAVIEPQQLTVKWGEHAVFNASRSFDPNPSGYIAYSCWYLESQVVAEDSLTLSIDTLDLEPGVYEVALYLESVYGPANTSTATLIVESRLLTEIQLSASQEVSEVGSDVTFTVTCLDQDEEPIAGISVELRIDNETLTLPATGDDGKSSLTYTFTSTGTFTIRASYGDVVSNEVIVEVTSEEVWPPQNFLIVPIVIAVIVAVAVALIVAKLR